MEKITARKLLNHFSLQDWHVEVVKEFVNRPRLQGVCDFERKTIFLALQSSEDRWVLYHEIAHAITPGGGLTHGEDFHAAARRVIEFAEAGAAVSVHRITTIEGNTLWIST
jgi:hypothetical protein